MSVPALNHIPRSMTSFQHFGIKGEKGINLNNRLLEREPMDTF